jgi:hypothetical protein
MHPDLARAHVSAWEERERRQDIRNASLQFTIAQWSGNLRKGASLKVSDFMPVKAKQKRNEGAISEARLKISTMRMEAVQNRKK